MHVTRFDEANPYDAPRHHDVTALRLQGEEASPTEIATVGLSHFLPGGSAELSSSPRERVYVVLDGAVTVTAGGEQMTLGKYDSCLIPSGEEREVVNNSNNPATMLVIMPPLDSA